MNIYCDESGGVGRGAMTLAAAVITTEHADALLARFREVTGLTGELKGSRIGLPERALFFELFVRFDGRATVGFAGQALRPDPGADRGLLDRTVYALLLEDVVGSLLEDVGGCATVTIDDGRYDPATLALIRSDIGTMLGPWSRASLELSHRSAGLQIADVIANSFFNRAFPSDRQARIAAMVEPLLESGRLTLRVLADARLDTAP